MVNYCVLNSQYSYIATRESPLSDEYETVYYLQVEISGHSDHNSFENMIKRHRIWQPSSNCDLHKF